MRARTSRTRPAVAANAAKKQPARPSGSVSLTQRMRGVNRWRDQYNPLRALTIARAVTLLEQYQRGEYADPLWTMFFVEQRDADMIALIELTTAAITELDWNIKIVAEEDRRSDFDQGEAEKQAQYLRDAYDRIENLYEAIEHLAMSRFRGFALAQPQIRSGDEEPVATPFGANHIECIDSWNVARDGLYGDWYWNPEAKSTNARALGDAARIEPEGMLIRTSRRPIDIIALIKFIRMSLSEKDWDSFIEVYGVPQPIIIGPPDLPDDKRTAFEDAAADIGDGGGGYLPSGSDVKYPDSVRGVTPFKERLNHLTEKLVLAGTGGMLTMLTQSGSGTLAGGAHMETFKRIARGEARRISEVFQKQFDRLLLEQAFPGKQIFAYWELAANEEQDVGEIIEHNAALASSGFRIKQSSIEEATGYELEPFTPPGSATGGAPGADGSPRQEQPSYARNRATATAGGGPDPEGLSELLAAAGMELAQAQRSALEVLAGPLTEIYRKAEEADASPEELAQELRELKERLPDMLKDMNAEPETAAVLERLMAAALANGVGEEAALTKDGGTA